MTWFYLKYSWNNSFVIQSHLAGFEESMKVRISKFASLTVASFLTGCSILSPAAPTPFTFPTPNLTTTAFFAPEATDTPLPPTLPPLKPTATQTALPASNTPTQGSLENSPTALPGMSERTTVSANKTGSAPQIDGNLDDWGELPYDLDEVVFGNSSWSGFADSSATYNLRWDDANLFLAVRIRDDLLVQNSSGDLIYQGDDIEIQLDTELSQDSGSTILSKDDYQLGFSVGDFDVPGSEVYRWFPASLEGSLSGPELAVEITAVGYDAEIRIPWADLGTNPVSGGQFGFTLSLSDNDLAGTQAFQSLVSSVSTRKTTDPTTWGLLLLLDE
jgi:hypothetical protein